MVRGVAVGEGGGKKVGARCTDDRERREVGERCDERQGGGGGARGGEV